MVNGRISLVVNLLTQELSGAQMAGTYLHTEILSTDPYYQDKLIYAVHPFLKLWEGKIPKAFRKEA